MTMAKILNGHYMERKTRGYSGKEIEEAECTMYGIIGGDISKVSVRRGYKYNRILETEVMIVAREN